MSSHWDLLEPSEAEQSGVGAGSRLQLGPPWPPWVEEEGVLSGGRDLPKQSVRTRVEGPHDQNV